MLSNMMPYLFIWLSTAASLIFLNVVRGRREGGRENTKPQ